MATDPEERMIWLVGPQAELLQMGIPPGQQEVTRCFASLAQLPSPDQVPPRRIPRVAGAGCDG